MTNHSDHSALVQEIKYIKNIFVKFSENNNQYDLLACKEKLRKIIDSNFKTIVSSDKASEYTEIASGLYLALLKIDELPDKKNPEIDEMISLCIELSDYLIKELQVEKKVVYFLPYKLDMWDSLESIWQVLNEDEQFDVYVMPIPWFERNEDGNVKKWHCEINEFSKYVPVVDYRKVDLSVVKPDVIFIHNPYDGNNLITSVDERYYSNKLKQQTETLIYVPYFVVKDEINPDKCQCPAIQYADYVIVQDEHIKKIYEENYPWGDPKGKFLPFGSPKIDKILNSKRSDYVLPLAWRRKISGKKVILYNTSIRDMLENDDYYIDKLRSTFKFFKDKTDLVLWWRPHPLLKSSIRIIKPDIYQDYCFLEHQYKEQAFGIYDDSLDANRAIACSDAYYGDRSSLAWLYRMTGKTVMLQDYKKIDTDFSIQRTYFLTTDGKGHSWFTQRINGWQVLCKMDNISGETKILDILPNSYSKRYAYGALAYFDEKIIIVPRQENVPILIFDISIGDFSFETTILTGLKKSNICFFLEYAVENENNIFFVSARLDMILQFNKRKKRFKVNYLNAIGYIVEWSCINDDIIAVACGDKLGIIDTNTWSIIWDKLPDGNRIYTMNFINQMIWIVCTNGNKILCFDIHARTYQSFTLNNISMKKRMFYGLIQCKNSIIFLPGQADVIGVISKEYNGKIVYYRFNDMNEEINFYDEWVTAIDIKKYAGVVLLADGESFIYINEDLVELKKMNYEKKDIKEYFLKTAHKCVNKNEILQDCIEAIEECEIKKISKKEIMNECAVNMLMMLKK